MKQRWLVGELRADLGWPQKLPKTLEEDVNEIKRKKQAAAFSVPFLPTTLRLGKA